MEGAYGRPVAGAPGGPDESMPHDSQSTGGGGSDDCCCCLSGDRTFVDEKKKGRIALESVEIGDCIASVDRKTGDLLWDCVLARFHSVAWGPMDLAKGATANMIKVSFSTDSPSENGNDCVIATGSHMLLIDGVMTRADAVQKGQIMKGRNGRFFVVSSVSRVENEKIGNIFTESGSFLANGAVVSCYPQWMEGAHPLWKGVTKTLAILPRSVSEVIGHGLNVAAWYTAPVFVCLGSSCRSKENKN